MIKFKRVENIIGIVDGYYPVNEPEEQPTEVIEKATEEKPKSKKRRTKKDV